MSRTDPPLSNDRNTEMTDSFSRRELLKRAGVGAAAIGTTGWLAGCDDHMRSGTAGTSIDTASTPRSTTNSSRPSTSSTVRLHASADLASRMLVVVELDGGNDGYSTLVPYGHSEYYSARSRTAVPAADVFPLSDRVGLNNKLVHLNRRGAAIIQGIGSPNPDESHFEMLARWWSGDPESGSSFETGFLGRLADAIGDPAAAAVAVSIGAGAHPSMISAKVNTLCLPDQNAFTNLVGTDTNDQVRSAFQRAFASYATGEASNPLDVRLRAAKAQSVAFANALDVLSRHDRANGRSGNNGTDTGNGGYPDNPLGNALRLTANLLDSHMGVRIVHVPMQEDFDTHDNHVERHSALLESLDNSLEAFLADIERRALTNSVLVMTTSEFGRTLRDNGSSGLDHGTASVGMLLGPVRAGPYGEFPSLTKLNDNNEPIATVSFDHYYATVAQSWFGVPASDVLHGNVSPIADIVV